MYMEELAGQNGEGHSPEMVSVEAMKSDKIIQKLGSVTYKKKRKGRRNIKSF
jgi:hypothetical protein